MCPALFPTQINSISLIPNGLFWDLQAMFKQHRGLCLRAPLGSLIPPVPDVTGLHKARALIPITWDELAGSFSSHVFFIARSLDLTQQTRSLSFSKRKYSFSFPAPSPP